MSETIPRSVEVLRPAVALALSSGDFEPQDDGSELGRVIHAVLRRAAGALAAVPGKVHHKRVYAMRSVLPGADSTARAVREVVAAAAARGGIPSGDDDGSLAHWLANGAGSVDSSLRATAGDLRVLEAVTELFPLLVPEARRRVDYAILWLTAEGLSTGQVAKVVGTYPMHVQRRARSAAVGIARELLTLCPDIFTGAQEAA